DQRERRHHRCEGCCSALYDLQGHEQTRDTEDNGAEGESRRRGAQGGGGLVPLGQIVLGRASALPKIFQDFGQSQLQPAPSSSPGWRRSSEAGVLHSRPCSAVSSSPCSSPG